MKKKNDIGQNKTPSAKKKFSFKQINFKKIGKIFVISLLSFILLVNLITVTVSSLGLRRSLNFMPCAFVTIESGSMEPKLHKGDLIFVWRTSFADLEVGDVITYYSGEEFITHGISQIQNQEVITKGLQNELEDAPFGEEQYCAKMLFAITGGEALWNLLSEFWFTAVLLLIIAFACYGVPLFGWIYDKLTKSKTGKTKIGICRVLLSLTLASCVFITPFLSSAKYKSEIGGFILSSAESVYFKSNYLSAEGSNYYVNGWAGLGTDINLEIRNWANQLLYNTSEDVSYIIKIEQKTAEAKYEPATGGYQVGQTFYEKKAVYTAYLGTVAPQNDTLYVKDGENYEEASEFALGNEYYTRSYEYALYEGKGQGTVPDLFRRTQKPLTGDYTIGIRNMATGYKPAEYDPTSGKTYYYDAYTEYVHVDGEDYPEELFEIVKGKYRLTSYDENKTLYTHAMAEFVWDHASEIPTVYLAATDVYGPFTIGSGGIINQSYDITLSSTRTHNMEIIPLSAGESIQFVITVETVSSNYHQTLTGTFSMDVAASSSFIGEGKIEEENNSSIAKYTLYTNRIAESAFRTVVFKWNTSELDINRLISPVWDYINQQDEKNPCYVVDETTKEAKLTVTLQAPAMVPFQFFKTDSSKKLTVGDVVTEDETDYITFYLSGT